MSLELISIFYTIERLVLFSVQCIGLPVIIIYGIMALRSQHRKNLLQIKKMNESNKFDSNT